MAEIKKPVTVTIAGEELVIMTRAEYESLIDRLEDAADLAAVRRPVDPDGLLPQVAVERLARGHSPVAVWRDQRAMTRADLAIEAGLSYSYVADIETGRAKGSVDALAAIAKALRVAVDDLVPQGDTVLPGSRQMEIAGRNLVLEHQMIARDPKS